MASFYEKLKLVVLFISDKISNEEMTPHSRQESRQDSRRDSRQRQSWASESGRAGTR